MVDAYRLRTPLDHLSLGAAASEDNADAGVVMTEVPYRGLINIRGDADDPKFAAAVKKATRIDLPTNANTVTGKPSTTRIMWLGPDEWLVITKPGGGPRMFTALRKALKIDGLHASVTDSSESRTCIQISGKNARETLMKGCSIDLHPSALGPGDCAQTIVSKILVMIAQTAATKDGRATYELYPLRSFSTYLWTWLADAADEYGMRVE